MLAARPRPTTTEGWEDLVVDVVEEVLGTLDEVTLNKKHFGEFASAISSLELPLAKKKEVASAIAGVLSNYNPAFKAETFVRAAIKTQAGEDMEPETEESVTEDVVVSFHKDSARDFLRFINRAKLEEAPSIACRGDQMYAAIPRSVAEAMSTFFEADYSLLEGTKEEYLAEIASEALVEGVSRNEILDRLCEQPWVTRKIAETALKNLAEEVKFKDGKLLCEGTTLAEVKTTAMKKGRKPGRIAKQAIGKMPKLAKKAGMPKKPNDVGPGSMDGEGKPEIQTTEQIRATLVNYLGEQVLGKLVDAQVNQIKDESPDGLKALGKLLKGKTDAECRALLAMTLGESEYLDEAKASMECMECGKKFKADPSGDPECPKCGSSDIELAESAAEASLKHYLKSSGGKATYTDRSKLITDDKLATASDVQIYTALRHGTNDILGAWDKLVGKNEDIDEAKGVACTCDECDYEATCKPGSTCPECEEGTMVPDDGGDDEEPEDEEEEDGEEMEEGQGEAHACHNCSAMGTNTSGGCQNSVAVAAKHGAESLEQWRTDSLVANSCSYYKQITTQEAVEGVRPFAEGEDYPIHDKAHVLASIAFAKKHRNEAAQQAWPKIVEAAKKFGIEAGELGEVTPAFPTRVQLKKGQRVSWKAPDGTLMQGTVFSDVGEKHAVTVQVTNPTPKKGEEQVLVPYATLKIGRVESVEEAAKGKCQCADKECPEHKGSSKCMGKAVTTLYRVDMEDKTGTPMCRGCADDAMESGMFDESEDEAGDILACIELALNDEGDEIETIEAEMDEAKKDTGGRWVTTKGGHKLHFNSKGIPDKGNPKVIAAASAKMKAKGTAAFKGAKGKVKEAAEGTHPFA
jgi:predicted Zn-ribbon and HTH transcriptional regulator